ncbi:hypothetical protein [Sphingomonas jatrophae]|uniref:Bacterial OB-fold domain-containing protein n=1 Tax=Sphingomonas jatrophae TaxID=1166337 RepID=A0A1I6M9Q5_9SPHN|nr:hypothetical protein [Sphingomonas jatrophae]SFS12435.1 hypothetical protein SAMN05192580_3744 [Sphingomonas jatrophae]
MTDRVLPLFRPAPNGKLKLTMIAAALLAVGGVGGAVAMAETRPSVTMAPVRPVAIRSLASDSDVVSIRGRVAEIYGNKFIVDDGTGRVLVETGPQGDSRPLVTVNAPVTVQGRFGRGFMHAAFLVGADDKVIVLGPPAPPPHKSHPPRPAAGPRQPGAPMPAPTGDTPPPAPVDAEPAAPASGQ